MALINFYPTTSQKINPDNSIGFGARYDGYLWRSTREGTSSSFLIEKDINSLNFKAGSSTSINDAISWKMPFVLSTNGYGVKVNGFLDEIIELPPEHATLNIQKVMNGKTFIFRSQYKIAIKDPQHSEIPIGWSCNLITLSPDVFFHDLDTAQVFISMIAPAEVFLFSGRKIGTTPSQIRSGYTFKSFRWTYGDVGNKSCNLVQYEMVKLTKFSSNNYSVSGGVVFNHVAPY